MFRRAVILFFSFLPIEVLILPECKGRTELHHAGRLRGDSIAVIGRASIGLCLPRQDHALVLRLHEVLHGASPLRRERRLFSFTRFVVAISSPVHLAQLTVLGMKHADENVALQAVEFWSTVCDEEIELALEAEEAAEYSETPERESSHFARVALPEILPVFLLLLTKQDEDATDDEWNVSMAAGTCLALLAQCVGDGIVGPIIPFVESNIKNPDWRYREAAVMAFGSILDGPEEKILAPLVAQALPTLIEMMRDPSLQVRDTTAWTLGRVSDVLVKTIKTDTHLPPLISSLLGSLEESPRIVSNCCWTIMNLAEQLGDSDADTCPLSAFYDPIVSALLRLAEKYGLLFARSSTAHSG